MTTFLDLSVRRGNSLVIDNARIDVPSGTVTGLVAPNGSGRETLLDRFGNPGTSA